MSAPRSSAPATRAGSRPQARIGRYRVVSRLGRGGMGMVYRGLDEALEREVAVKTLTAEGTFDEENRRRFEIEAKAAAKLQHPNIVTVYELGEDRGVPFIAMELLPGSDLEQLLRSGESLTLHEKLDIVTQVCRGLAFAHEHRVVHRDIKPSNIRLLDDGSVKIMDFGIAKLGGTNVTRAGMMVGTMNYMSPEQIRGLPLDGRSDVFSLGVILHQMLAGRRPFVGKGGPDVLYKIVQEPTPRLGVDLGPQTARLQQIVDRALEKEPQQRYASAGELGDELERVARAVGREEALQAADQEALLASRRALKEGRLDEALGRLEPVLARRPDSLDARRLLRAVERERKGRAQPEPAGDEFPELEATYRAHVTQKSPVTVTAAGAPPATPVPAAPAPSAPPASPATRSAGPWIAAAAGALLLAALGAGVLLLRGRATTEPSPGGTQAAKPSPSPPGPGARTATPTPKPQPVALKVAVATEPAGASLSLDGAPAGRTPAEIEVDPTVDHELVAAQDGFASQRVKLSAGRIPPSLNLTLEPTGPPGVLNVVSAYPVDVLWKGKLLAKGQVSPKVSLPPGRHTVQVVAAAHFARKEASLEMRAGGNLGLEMPGLGRINIKAHPDNCQVLIDGGFVDYPPILDRPIAEGKHTVTFQWPDGHKKDESVEVARGGIAYVMGRRP